jgi:heptaprenyl diphosphate synthase
MKSKKVAIYGLLVALAFILSYIESLFPLAIAIPGIKLGLANLVVIVAIYKLGVKEAFTLSIIRIILVGFTFGSPSTMMFSLVGGLLSWLLMVIFQKTKLFSMVGVSIIGGIAHNIGQIIVSILVLENINIIYYLPFLLVSGVITGGLIGILAAIIIKRLKSM